MNRVSMVVWMVLCVVDSWIIWINGMILGIVRFVFIILEVIFILRLVAKLTVVGFFCVG